MEKKITCFIPASDRQSLAATIDSLTASGVVDKVYIIGVHNITFDSFPGASVVKTDSFSSTDTVRRISQLAATEYTLIYTRSYPLDPGNNALRRMMQVCSDTDAGMVYSAYYVKKQGSVSPQPLVDYQEGSIRDDFNFGSVILYHTPALREACEDMSGNYSFAGLYDLRLKVSQKEKIVYIPEMLYTEIDTDLRSSGEKQFDYVNPGNRSAQIEMEKVCSDHLKRISAWLKPEFKEIDVHHGEFMYEASVIIPVKNRVRTISDAVNSVLTQETAFSFNLIVVDNYSTDGTTEILKNIAQSDPRLIHIIPHRKDLGIGGCWNEGIYNNNCGRFAVQLDSDDLYINNKVLSLIVNEFYLQKCAMVIGSYKIVDFQLNYIPPGLIDHREWTPENGRNNALRINGLGAPRAFYTPVLRSIGVPNVSYGEDYAVGLAICRHYRVGRIYEPLYLCRRWEDNSDASLDINKTNIYNFYKDRIRTIEILARKRLVAEIN